MPSAQRIILVSTNSVCTPGRRCSVWIWQISSSRRSWSSKAARNPAEADGKSVMQMIILAATEGTELKITAEGEDAEPAVAKLAELFENKFGEGE